MELVQQALNSNRNQKEEEEESDSGHVQFCWVSNIYSHFLTSDSMSDTFVHVKQMPVVKVMQEPIVDEKPKKSVYVYICLHICTMTD